MKTFFLFFFWSSPEFGEKKCSIFGEVLFFGLHLFAHLKKIVVEVHPPMLKIGKNWGKIANYPPNAQQRSAPLCTRYKVKKELRNLCSFFFALECCISLRNVRCIRHIQCAQAQHSRKSQFSSIWWVQAGLRPWATTILWKGHPQRNTYFSFTYINLTFCLNFSAKVLKNFLLIACICVRICEEHFFRGGFFLQEGPRFGELVLQKAHKRQLPQCPHLKMALTVCLL